jgi:hypothetical protein
MAPATKAILTVPHRFNGPPASANGGYLAGLLAEHAATPATGGDGRLLGQSRSVWIEVAQ